MRTGGSFNVFLEITGMDVYYYYYYFNGLGNWWFSSFHDFKNLEPGVINEIKYPHNNGAQHDVEDDR
jgi:hypothetical protein